MSEKTVLVGVNGDDQAANSHSPSPGPQEALPDKETSEEEIDGGEITGADGKVEEFDSEGDGEYSGSEAEQGKETTTKPKPKKPVLVNVFLRCTSNDLVSDPEALKTFLHENDITVKEIQPSTEPSWIRLGHVELEETEDRDKAVSLCGQTLAGKELRIERARDSVSDRLYAPDDCILFIRNLSKSVTEETVHTLFPKAKEVRLPKKNGKNRGFAFINFATKKEVDDLIRERQSEEHDGKTMKLGTYTSRDRYETRKHTKGNSAKKTPAVKSPPGKTGSTGKSGSGRSNSRQQYNSNYGMGRYHGNIQPLLDVDTSSYRNGGQRRYRDYDDYGFYNNDFTLENYLYDLQSRMGLESGLAKRMGLNRGYTSHYDYGMDSSNGLYGFSSMGYGQRFASNRQDGFTGYSGMAGYADNYRQSDRKRNKSGGNRSAKGKSGWPAK